MAKASDNRFYHYAALYLREEFAEKTETLNDEELKDLIDDGLRAAQAADIPNVSLTSVFNLPITIQVYMGVSKVADKVEKAAQKIKKIFSSEHMAPVPEKKQDAAGRLTGKLLKRKQNER